MQGVVSHGSTAAFFATTNNYYICCYATSMSQKSSRKIIVVVNQSLSHVMAYARQAHTQILGLHNLFINIQRQIFIPLIACFKIFLVRPTIA